MQFFIFLIFVFFLNSSSAIAKNVVISDIDDTLKVANVASKVDSVISAFEDHRYFVGMAQIFRAIKSKKIPSEFHYVSLAPEFLMYQQHKSFIKNHGFPLTQLHLNPSTQQNPKIKIQIIKKIIDETQPSTVIMFGDNGQMDAALYSEIQRQYPSISFLIFIHEVQSKIRKAKYPTQKNQVGYVTSLELAHQLIQNDVIDSDVYGQIENLVYTRMQYAQFYERLGQYVIPAWMDCRDFRWPESFPVVSEKAIAIKKNINTRCQLAPKN